MNGEPIIQANKKGRENGFFYASTAPPRHMTPVVGALF